MLVHTEAKTNMVNKLFEFINSSPTAYHTVDTLKKMLLAAGYTELSEKDSSDYSDGGKHFVIRGGTSIIAFSGKTKDGGFMITASHSDSPAFKVKVSEECVGAYVRLNTEKYGGMMYYTWLDIPLSVAGRVTVRTKDGIATRLVNIDRDLAVIPSVAIHLNRTVNEACKLNPAVDLLPLYSLGKEKGGFMKLIAEAAGVAPSDIVSHDLYVYNRQKGTSLGEGGELILSPRLDDLECVFASCEAFLSAPDTEKAVKVLAVFDNEEVGSETKQGANSTFLDQTLRKIAGSDEKYLSMLGDSFMISADNAHAKHPNHPELSDAECSPILGGGVAIKYNANQRYTTDGVSGGVFKIFAERAGVTLQSFANRADMLGGSTLGSISNTRVSIPTVDIGLPQLAMHSATETAAASDVVDMIAVLREAYSSAVRFVGDEIKIIK